MPHFMKKKIRIKRWIKIPPIKKATPFSYHTSLIYAVIPFQLTVGQNQVVLRHQIIHFPTSSGVSELVSEQISAVERFNEASFAEQPDK